MACDLCQLLASPPADGLLWRDALLSVVLVDEPHYPGFARVVWNSHVKEMTDLLPAEREHVMWAVWQVEAAQRLVLSPDKINVASFGNMTPHVHWHVIPRYATDVHFPQPTWGTVQREPDAQEIAARRALLPQLRAAIVANLNGN
jgi:diadenosine tetraphosphate (Ap4A) HIT family hydrolase